MTQPPPDIHAKAFLQDTAPASEQVHIDTLTFERDLWENAARIFEEQIKRLDEEQKRLETELNHFYGLCVDDPGKNPPLFWKDVAAEQKTLIRELVAALKAAKECVISCDAEFPSLLGEVIVEEVAAVLAKAKGYEP